MVTAIGGGGHGDQILKALKLSSPQKYYIIGTDINPNCPQQELVNSFELLPPASDGAYLSSLVETCERQAVEVLFHLNIRLNSTGAKRCKQCSPVTR